MPFTPNPADFQNLIDSGYSEDEAYNTLLAGDRVTNGPGAGHAAWNSVTGKWEYGATASEVAAFDAALAGAIPDAFKNAGANIAESFHATIDPIAQKVGDGLGVAVSTVKTLLVLGIAFGAVAIVWKVVR